MDTSRVSAVIGLDIGHGTVIRMVGCVTESAQLSGGQNG